MPKRKVKEAAEAPDGTKQNPVKRASSSKPMARSIDFAVAAPDAKAVCVVGEFNDWSVETHPLQQQDYGTWRITLQLPPGRYQYKFVIDGNKWEDDADNPHRMTNEFGTSNSILEVV